VNKKNMVAIPADPNDDEDFDVTFADLERARMGRWFRMVRRKLDLTQEQFAQTYGIPLNSLRQYEIGRYMPPPATRAYLKVIEAEPEVVKRVVAGVTYVATG
jgi:putative transcriptional regulator